MSSLQGNISTASDEASALERVRHTSGYSRFIYGVYLILGIIFCGIGIYTALGIVMRSLNGGAIFSFETLLLLCYVLLNGIIGYGLLFYRKWLLVAFTTTLALMGLLASFFLMGNMVSRAASLLTSVCIIAGILFFLFLSRKFLSGRYFEPKANISVVVALLVSFLLTNFGMLN